MSFATKKVLLGFLVGALVGGSTFGGAMLYSNSVQTSVLQSQSQEEAFKGALNRIRERQRTTFQEEKTPGMHGSAEDAILENTPICKIYLASMFAYHTNAKAYEYQMANKWFSQSCKNNPEFAQEFAGVQACVELLAESTTDFKNPALTDLVSAKHALGCSLHPENVKEMSAKYMTAQSKFCSEMRDRMATGKRYFFNEKDHFEKDCK